MDAANRTACGHCALTVAGIETRSCISRGAGEPCRPPQGLDTKVGELSRNSPMLSESDHRPHTTRRASLPLLLGMQLLLGSCRSATGECLGGVSELACVSALVHAECVRVQWMGKVTGIPEQGDPWKHGSTTTVSGTVPVKMP